VSGCHPLTAIIDDIAPTLFNADYMEPLREIKLCSVVVYLFEPVLDLFNIVMGVCVYGLEPVDL